MSKLTLLHINLIGVVVAIIVGVALYFTIITGAQDEIKKKQSELDTVKAEAAKLQTAKNALAKAQEEEKQATADYARYEAMYMPTLHYTNNRITTMMTVWWPNKGRSWPERFLRGVREHMARERKVNGVVWLNPETITLPPYGPDPNTIDMGEGDNALTFGPYEMSVRGRNYDSLMRHIKSWNNVKLLGVPVVDQVQLSGNSPNLVATYSLTFTIILHEPIPGQSPRVSGTSSGAGGGPRMGGMRGGMMGSGPMMGGMMGPPGSASMMSMMRGGGGGGAPGAVQEER